ncbi:MAG TPA: chemotaxis-specific protein-glutamate methyltransferase CheB [Candidatus Kapabacteria bacterium]|nr:chemotaxis-specific protein-glutamate methyltransferase CheB [Candidatus Kapabacteria bacterium]
MNIAIVNDLDIEIEAIKRIITSIGKYSILWVAKDGFEAINLTHANKPDLILMNLNMPKCDGVQATKEIMRDNPTPIIIVSSSLKLYQSKIFEAMALGALDVSTIPSDIDYSDLKNIDLVKKIEMIAKLTNKQSIDSGQLSPNAKGAKLVLIGASTGGPKVIAKILESLPNKINGSLTIVQHLDAKFTNGMVEWLKNYTSININVVEFGTSIENNNIYVVGGDEHFQINSYNKFETVKATTTEHFIPSINIMFNSFANNYKNNGMAIILTGMGNDGTKGMLSLKKKNWLTLAQDETSSVVYGMPKAAYESGAAKKTLNIEGLIYEINNYLKDGK